eukprot:767152-Hanusia_phi.AAC.1
MSSQRIELEFHNDDDILSDIEVLKNYYREGGQEDVGVAYCLELLQAGEVDFEVWEQLTSLFEDFLFQRDNFMRGSTHEALKPMLSKLQSLAHKSCRQECVELLRNLKVILESMKPKIPENSRYMQEYLSYSKCGKRKVDDETRDPAPYFPKARRLNMQGRQRISRETFLGFSSAQEEEHTITMQEIARQGQRRWAEKLQKLKERWQRLEVVGANPNFCKQINYCRTMKLKKQKEALLLYFQMSAKEQLIIPLNFRETDSDCEDTSSDKRFQAVGGRESKSFVGWVGFRILPAHANKFLKGLELLLQEEEWTQDDFEKIREGSPRCSETFLSSNSFHNVFRRIGFAPAEPGRWMEVFCGSIPIIHHSVPKASLVNMHSVCS